MAKGKRKLDHVREIEKSVILAIAIFFTAFDGGATADEKGAMLKDNAKPQGSTLTQPTKGKPVTLHLGKGFNDTAAAGIALTLESLGCTTKVLYDGMFDGGIEVDVGNGEHYQPFDTGSAASVYAERHCVSP